jgi:hypothetical protein
LRQKITRASEFASTGNQAALDAQSKRNLGKTKLNDFTAYKIGNLMYNLANRGPAFDSRGNAILDWQGNALPSLPGAPIPIAGSDIQLAEFKLLNDGNLQFSKMRFAFDLHLAGRCVDKKIEPPDAF